MYKEFYTQSLGMNYALFALVFFLVFFAGAVWFAFRRRNVSRFNAAAQLPLMDDTHPAAPPAARGLAGESNG